MRGTETRTPRWCDISLSRGRVESRKHRIRVVVLVDPAGCPVGVHTTLTSLPRWRPEPRLGWIDQNPGLELDHPVIAPLDDEDGSLGELSEDRFRQGNGSAAIEGNRVGSAWHESSPSIARYAV